MMELHVHVATSIVELNVNMCGSAHCCGRTVNGSVATVAF